MIKTIGVLGTGVIGAGWAARACKVGIDVIACDISPKGEAVFRQSVERGIAALDKLMDACANMPAHGRLSFTTDLAEMARNVDFLQENVPEDLAIKREALSHFCQHARPDVVIASSTSGILPSDIQNSMPNPGRFCVGHPFNPVYLLPLVEVVPGSETDEECLMRAKTLYRRMGMHPLRVTREIPGHISDRLQEALWREILHMVANDEATTDQLDQAITYGPGLRWAIMGTNMIFHLAGGEAGMRHMLEQFGPCLQWPWTRLQA
ncbi:MAG: 3-hydroxyacyl-CoA dehydrogenase NAD-binding domain-containing protein, partial [Pseudomonadota bacterium]